MDNKVHTLVFMRIVPYMFVKKRKSGVAQLGYDLVQLRCGVAQLGYARGQLGCA
jgi:hypothetical protein